MTAHQTKPPLRKIVSYGENKYGLHTETLECGHTVIQKKDIYGYTNAVRRRCWVCFHFTRKIKPTE